MDDQNRKSEEWYSYHYRSERTDSERTKDGTNAADAGAEWAAGESRLPSSSAYPYSSYGTGTQEAYGADARNAYPETTGTGGAGMSGGTSGPVHAPRRPFTVSGNVRYWEAKPARRRSFGAMFASFLAGVLLVGSLMFAADHYNWFSGITADAGTAAPPGGANVRQAANSAAGGEPDVVRPNNIAQIFEQANPAVVKIETYTKSGARTFNPFSDNPWYWFFFGDEGQQEGKGELQKSGEGSGFFFDADGYILTNQHVIDDAAEIQVRVIGYNEPFKAKLLGHSYDLDLAVLKIEGRNFPTLPLGDSDAMNIGDWVLAIGNPYGFDHTLTVGVISAKERPIPINDGRQIRQYENLLQTDASINPGNSGGPLLNLKGEVIGINTAVSTQAQGIGFAIPSNTVLEVLEQLKNNEQPPAPFIGATLMDLTPELAERLGLKGTEGSLVQGVIYGSPAYEGDLRQYDVIVGMDDKNYKTKEELIKAIQSRKVGDKVTLHVIRAGKEIDIQVVIGDKNKFEQMQRP